MRSVDFNAANAYPGAPHGWDAEKDGPCYALPVVTDGRRFVSAWALETGDLERLKAGANVLLTCVGGQAPVHLEVADPSVREYWEKGTDMGREDDKIDRFFDAAERAEAEQRAREPDPADVEAGGGPSRGPTGYAGADSVGFRPAGVGGKVQGLPVAGYQPQTTAAVDLVNGNKALEEHLLRRLDAFADLPKGTVDPRWLAVARTHVELAFMAFNRAVFQPARLTDAQLAEYGGFTVVPGRSDGL